MQQADNLGAIPGIDHGFCTINDPMRPDDVFFCKQVHSASVIEWQPGQVANTLEADGVFTHEHQPIAVITADCLPILIAAKNAEKVAAVHGGWKGLQGGIVANAIQRFVDEGITVDQLQVAIGPSIKPCCYEVSEAFVAQFPMDQKHLWQHTQPAPLLAPQIAPPHARQVGSAWFDLSGYGVMLLLAAGVKRAQIEVSKVCTYCSSPSFASYRRRTHHPEEPKTLIYSWVARKA
ncbi:peptidoglycan editing factor PgeF [Pseudomonas sp. B22129]|uniref:peptidoglycan editing factor PgeF n=1 Tax=Pseudomonas sp. B22129 TaxID=3235111 RepID=UPI003784505A